MDLQTNITAEIIYTSTTEIIGQGHSRSKPFPYGSFVSAGKHAKIVGLIYSVETTSIDAHRSPMAFGIEEDQIDQYYPNNSWLLRPQIKALLIGQFNPNFTYGLPSTPPPIHGELSLCSQEQLNEIIHQLDFLRLVFSSSKSNIEELILSACKNLIFNSYNITPAERHAYAIKIGKALSDLYRDDYDTLRRMLGRLETWLT